jgi:hypothetical protein
VTTALALWLWAVNGLALASTLRRWSRQTEPPLAVEVVGALSTVALNLAAAVYLWRCP